MKSNRIVFIKHVKTLVKSVYVCVVWVGRMGARVRNRDKTQLCVKCTRLIAVVTFHTFFWLHAPTTCCFTRL